MHDSASGGRSEEAASKGAVRLPAAGMEAHTLRGWLNGIPMNSYRWC